MHVRRVLAGVCAVAGITLLAGPGWALLAAAAILFLYPPPVGVHGAVLRVREAAAAAGRWIISGRRQAKAAAAMPLAILGLASGLSLAVGVGWGIAAAGLCVGGLSLAADKAD